MKRALKLLTATVLVCVAVFSSGTGTAGLTPRSAVIHAEQPTPLRADDLAGLRLRNIGPANMSGRFVDMDVVESDPYVMYVASATGGVFRTRDAGITWEAVFEREPVHSVGDIVLFQPNPNIFWVGTGERANRQSVGWGDGVYKSTDAGKQWSYIRH